MKLVKYDSKWGDVMDISGWSIMSDSYYAQWVKLAKQSFIDYTYHMGANSEIEYDTYEQFEADFEVCEIALEHAAVIEEHFGTSYGLFPKF